MEFFLPINNDRNLAIMKVHLILNSHLDPVWLWRRSQGADEVLGTARTACDLLDLYPEIVITRGEMWFYEVVESCDPVLFERIRTHVKSGRWQVVGGWYVQPDCNLTGAHIFEKHGEFGRRYFEEKFGVRVKTAFHVDSFGHAATLPDFLKKSGFENYVMMRPSEGEMHLPANTFLWESPSGNRIRTFRISRSYCTTGKDTDANMRANLDAALADANPEIGHVMCFVGVGNHGGGPAKREIDWLNDHLHYRDGVELVYSSPDRYFAEVTASGAELPVVSTELQHHAIGCYTSVSRIKREVRRTEQLLHQAEQLRRLRPAYFDAEAERELEPAWKRLLFATFHDVLPGSSIRSAYEDIFQDLGYARSIAQQQIERAIRRENATLEPCGVQRLIFDNPSETEFDGLVEFEPWLGYLWAGTDRPKVHLTEEDGTPIPVQEVTAEAALDMARYVARLRIPGGGRKIVLIHTDGALPEKGGVRVSAEQIGNGKLIARLGGDGVVSLSDGAREFLAAPLRAVVIDDPSDTWSHGLKCYDTKISETFEAKENGRIVTGRCGPLSGEVWFSRKVSCGTLKWRVRMSDGENALELRLRLAWNGCRKLVKLLIHPGFVPVSRLDGAPGGVAARICNGEEYPMTDFVSVLSPDGRRFAVASPDVTGVDVQPDGMIRLTLLRSPCYAHHDPFQLPADNDYPVTDQGEHEYRILLLPEAGGPEEIRRACFRLTDPLWFSESTRGCGFDIH